MSKKSKLPFSGCRCVKHPGCKDRISDTAIAFASMVNALEALEAYARFMARHSATNPGIDSPPLIGLIVEALAKAKGEVSHD